MRAHSALLARLHQTRHTMGTRGARTCKYYGHTHEPSEDTTAADGVVACSTCRQQVKHCPNCESWCRFMSPKAWSERHRGHKDFVLFGACEAGRLFRASTKRVAGAPSGPTPSPAAPKATKRPCLLPQPSHICCVVREIAPFALPHAPHQRFLPSSGVPK